ncbi:hypothetical protein CWI37_0040p0010 [Hamiltosporidium tvaerminnensis]|nr:hypothetical protein CWI37_0040p0010 [Hamiltosporidium tvaerminnensis]
MIRSFAKYMCVIVYLDLAKLMSKGYSRVAELKTSSVHLLGNSLLIFFGICNSM